VSRFAGAGGLPFTHAAKGVTPINHFDASRYLGKWYEIARLDNRFERGLEQVTATYGKRQDGGISVLNRGFDPQKASGRERGRLTSPASRTLPR
jgi:lipocalin